MSGNREVEITELDNLLNQLDQLKLAQPKALKSTELHLFEYGKI